MAQGRYRAKPLFLDAFSDRQKKANAMKASRMGPRLRNLVIKPELRCTARCPTCVLRRDLHDQVRDQRLLSLEEWDGILREARLLGGRNLDISGGEPTLYRQLPDLIRLAKKRGWIVQINSNGSLMSKERIRTLVEAGIDRVMISLYSHEASVHDAMRGLPGLWKRATDALALWAEQKSRQRGLEVVAQTLLAPQNLSHLPQLLRLLKKLGCDGAVLSYLEGNYDDRKIFDISQLQYFLDQVRPELKELFDGRDLPDLFARRRCNRLFSTKRRSLNDWASGLYHGDPSSCVLPSGLALILANGDVHPCNIVEYVHEPVMGNLFKTSLTDMWRSKAWADFRKQGHSECRRCPMALQCFIPFTTPRWAVLRKRWVRQDSAD